MKTEERSVEFQEFMKSPVGLVAFDRKVTRVSRTDLRETRSFSDFIANIGLEDGEKLTINGMLDVPSDCSWLDIEAGDTISFTFKGIKRETYKPEETASGAEPQTIISHVYMHPILLDKQEGTARKLQSQANVPESGWASKLKPPRSKQAGGGSLLEKKQASEGQQGGGAENDTPPED